LARALHCELEVLRVAPALSVLERVERDRRREQRRARAYLRETKLWLASALGEDEPQPGRVIVRSGKFANEVIDHAAARPGVALVVLAPEHWRMGSLATKVARCTGLSVVVARERSHGLGILAATDLRSPDFPVLRQAARLGNALKASVTALHNVEPLGTASSDADPYEGLHEHERRLDDVANALDGVMLPVVSEEVDPVIAIRKEATHRNVDLIVVGVHQAPWLERLFYGSVASRIVQLERSSVVIVPMSDAF
jgi:nucleotide-binding universal stress UspA family protein